MNARTERGQRGQILVLGLFFIIGLSLAAFSVVNIGIMAAERVRAQNSADAAAYSAATVEARYMNLAAYVNRAMVANYNAMAFNMALYATVDADDHGGAMIAGMMYSLANILTAFAGPLAKTISDIGKGIDRGFHKPMHSFNRALYSMFDPGQKNLNVYLERYNTDILSMYHGLLFSAAQGVRFAVTEAVAKKVDPAVTTRTLLSLGTESYNYEQLAETVDYAREKPEGTGGAVGTVASMFDSMMAQHPEDKAPLYLGALSNASLDRFAAGRLRNGEEDTLRNFNTNNIISHTYWIKWLMETIKLRCYANLVWWMAQPKHWGHSFHCDSSIEANLGAQQSWGQETSLSQVHVPIISSKRLREVNRFGGNFNLQLRIDDDEWVDFGGLVGGGGGGDDGENSGQFGFGYSSGTHDTEARSYYHSVDYGSEKWFECGFSPVNTTPWYAFWEKPHYEFPVIGCGQPFSSGCNQGRVNACIAQTYFALPAVTTATNDSHWEGVFSDPAASGSNILYGELDSPPAVVAIFNYDREVWRGFPPKLYKGVPNYQFRQPVKNTGSAQYIYRNTREPRVNGNSRNQGSFEGPSIAVSVVKSAKHIKTMRIPGLGNNFDIVALSRAQVYYEQSPNRPREQPSLLNPHWSARLAPIDSAGAGAFMTKWLPMVGNRGIPMTPVH